MSRSIKASPHHAEAAPRTEIARQQIRVRVLFFGAAREFAGHGELEIEIPAEVSVAWLKAEIVTRFPALDRFRQSLLIAVNEQYAPPETVLAANDEVAFFPPVSGGSASNAADFYELTLEPIDAGAFAQRVRAADCGATVMLDGYVREWTRGRKTDHLVYEVYPSMAIRELRRIGERARQQFEITQIGIVHRTGKLEIGETSVVIAVSAPHRRAAFAACEWLIRELKRTVPIWKKEFYADGEVWVEGEGAPPDERPAST